MLSSKGLSKILWLGKWLRMFKAFTPPCCRQNDWALINGGCQGLSAYKEKNDF